MVTQAFPAAAAPDLPCLSEHAWPVSGGHRLHVATYGSAAGLPALVVHGGPGSASTPMLRRGFDAAAWRVITIDQRGCGRSQPLGGVQANTTADLIDDMETVRAALGIERWFVVGGSWGASLGLAYAAAHSDKLLGLLLRSSFVARRSDVAAFFEGGPFDGSMATVLPALRAALHGGDAERCRRVALDWWHWERRRLGFGPAADPQGDVLKAVIDRYRVQSHYLAHDCWLDAPDLIQRAAAMTPRPTLLLHGTADRVCPIGAGRELAAAMPHAIWHEVPGAGHDPGEPAMIAAMTSALRALARNGHFDAAFHAPPAP